MRPSLRLALIAATSAVAFGLAATPVVHAAAPARELPPLVNTPLPEGNIKALVNDFGLIESDKPVREMVKGWTKPTKIVALVDNNSNRPAWFQEAIPGIKLVAVRTTKDAMKEIVDADVFVGDCGPKELIAAGKKLKYVHAPHGGMEGCVQVPEYTSGKVLLTNAQRVFGPVMAQHGIAMTLALYRGLDMYMRANVNHKFVRGIKDGVPVGKLRDIRGKTMLVVGLGGIGTQMAQLSHAIGMRVIATRASSHEGPDYVEYVGLANELPNLIGQADVVAMTAPYTPETTDLFNAAMFAKMKKGAIFINLARGEEAVTDDLVAALKSGQVGGAGLDVTAPGTLPENHPLWDAPNVIITPHISAHAQDENGVEVSGAVGEPGWQIMRENLRRYVAGEKVFSVVDATRGY